MSRIGKKPVTIPEGVTVNIEGSEISVQGPHGRLQRSFHPSIAINREDGKITLAPKERVVAEKGVLSHWGTARALLQNMVSGVHTPFERKLNLVGVGYRVALEGKKVRLNLGFSHPIDYEVEEGVNIVCPSPTEIQLTGIDKQRVGQVAANLRSFRPPEPYKGKGIRYADEVVILKEVKKK